MKNSELLGTAQPTREPLQGRSRASFQRMLIAAKKLLIERGNADFTLIDVSRLGKVSIGSIYCRFDSKDELIYAVQTSVQAEILKEQLDLIDQISTRADSLTQAVVLLVDALAESFRHHSPILRPIMLRASVDPVVADVGKAAYHQVVARVATAFLRHRDEIAHPDAERAADACFRIVYAAIARYLGFGTVPIASRQGDWDHLKQDLALMAASFLMATPVAAAHATKAPRRGTRLRSDSSAAPRR